MESAYGLAKYEPMKSRFVDDSRREISKRCGAKRSSLRFTEVSELNPIITKVIVRIKRLRRSEKEHQRSMRGGVSWRYAS